jgi:hypothetical protein
VIAILKALPRLGEFVFPGLKPGKPLGNMAMLSVLKDTISGVLVKVQVAARVSTLNPSIKGFWSLLGGADLRMIVGRRVRHFFTPIHSL